VALYQSYCAPCTDHLQGFVNGEGAPSFSGHSVLGYCATTQSAQAPNHLERLYSAAGSDHFMTADETEKQGAVTTGYVLETAACWIP
jgi:hypothetical protein